MKRAVLLLIAAAAQGADRKAEMDDMARIASVMVDGDLCERIVTPRAKKAMITENPRDPYQAGDNYDVEHAVFIQVKKTLTRLSRLVEYPADVNLWMPVEGKPGYVHIVIRGSHEISQFWPWGALIQEMPPAMKSVLASGTRVTVTEKPGYVSVLAPVRNSLGDIVGVVEAVTQVKSDPRDNVK
jgi:hypothetical protein